MRRSTLIVFILLLFFLIRFDFSTLPAQAQAVIDPRLSERFAASPTGQTRFIVFLSARANLDAFARIEDRISRKMMVASALAATARSSQQPIIAALARLESQGLVSHYRPFFAVNGIVVDGGAAAARRLAGVPGVARIEAEDVVTIAGFPVSVAPRPDVAQQSNISQIHANDAWKLGFRGQGIIVGSIDTGVRHTHEALRAGYRCRRLANHSNCWLDAVNGLSSPYDDHNHGTHVTGTMAGRRGIGVAKSARWVACKALDASGNGTSSQLLACGDFFMGLALAADTAAFTPDVVNNSWAGGRGSTFFNETVNSWNAAGIHSAFAIGNTGPTCQTSRGPGEYTNAFGVGAVNSSDTIASFSSRGNASVVNSGTIKPDVVAPGVLIRSAVATCDTCYANFNGTSMATPHVAGTLALILSKNATLVPAGARSIVESTALNISDLTCGGTPSDNNVYGNGRIDALQAVLATP